MFIERCLSGGFSFFSPLFRQPPHTKLYVECLFVRTLMRISPTNIDIIHSPFRCSTSLFRFVPLSVSLTLFINTNFMSSQTNLVLYPNAVQHTASHPNMIFLCDASVAPFYGLRLFLSAFFRIKAALRQFVNLVRTWN